MDNDEYFGRTGEDDRAPEEPETADLSALTLGVKLGEDHERAESGAHLTLAAIEQLTGISYVTLQRYAQQFGDRLANVYEGTGRNRRYYPAAVEEFRKIKAEMIERRSGGGAREVLSTEPSAPTNPKPARRHSKSKAVRTKGHKGRSLSPGKKPPHGATGKARAVKKLPQGFRFIPSPAVAAPISPGKQPQPQPDLDLDRLARIYQLRLQLKTLDEVLAFVTDWRTKIAAEIADLEKLT